MASGRTNGMWKHGGSRTPEFAAWYRMLSRCDPRRAQTDPYTYAAYAGRGIRVYGHWRHDFEAFLEHVGPRPSPAHSLDRIDNDRGYFPGNVRWATATEQSRNTHRTRYLTWNGETLSVPEWADRTGISRRTINRRIECGWTPERILTTPTQR